MSESSLDSSELQEQPRLEMAWQPVLFFWPEVREDCGSLARFNSSLEAKVRQLITYCAKKRLPITALFSEVQPLLRREVIPAPEMIFVLKGLEACAVSSGLVGPELGYSLMD
jgi:hypothetical protein